MHSVREAQWSYLRRGQSDQLRQIDLAIPPPRYMAPDSVRESEPNQQKIQSILESNYSSAVVDHNMNEKIDSNGIDLPSLVSMEILESQVCDPGVNNEDIIKRVSEMHRIVADAEHYLAEGEANDFKQMTDKASEPLENSWDQTLRLKPTDSLLLLTQINGNTDNSVNDKQNGIIFQSIIYLNLFSPLFC